MHRLPQDFGKQKKREAVRRLSQGKYPAQPARRLRSASAGKRRPRSAGNVQFRNRPAGTTVMPSVRPVSLEHQQPPNPFQKTTESPTTFQLSADQFAPKMTDLGGVDAGQIQANPFLASLGQPVMLKDVMIKRETEAADFGAGRGGNPFFARVGAVRPSRPVRKRHHSLPSSQFTSETTQPKQSTSGNSSLFAKAVSAASNIPPAQHSHKTPYPSQKQQEIPFQMGVAHKSLHLSEDSMSKTSLHVKHIPYQVNTKSILMRHFGKFGKVVMVLCRPAKLCATVVFDSHASAARAKKEGKIMQEGSQSIQFQLFWNKRDQSTLSTPPQYTPTMPSQSIKTQPQPEQEEFLQDTEDETDTSSARQPVHGFTITINTKTGDERQVFKSDTIDNSNQVISAFSAKTVDGNKTTHASLQSRQPIKTIPPFSQIHPHYNPQPFSPLLYPNSSQQEVKKDSNEDGDLRQFIQSRQALPPPYIPTMKSRPNDVSQTTSSSLQSVSFPSLSHSISTGFAVTTAVEPVGLQTELHEPFTPPPLPEMVGELAQERYEALRERDAKMRQGIIKDSSLSTAKVVKGTCPDMCPEKERYMRLAQHELKSFEMTETANGEKTLDHAKAIKEYSRSSADKEEPLPHELRPPHILNMTMDYLLTNVMDEGENRWPQWFDFVWNRTRAIRKDLTQQQICSPLAVSLVEKTTRFHVFVAHQLCEEELLSFDPKINNENLTKCLQTLKQYYTDLRESGVKCESEPEFQCYKILMNLDQGDVLREVLTFPQWVRNAPSVVFALQVHAAFNSSNYVKFFRLVRKSRYLEACILHRYLTQMRVAAFQTMEKAYTMMKQMTSFPLPDIVQLLAFENEEEAIEFCHHYNISVKTNNVCLKRDAFTDPNKALPVRKLWHLIESKRTCLVSELIQAGHLPPPPTHIPQSSFDPLYRSKVEQLIHSKAQVSTRLPYSEQTVVQSEQKPMVPVITDQMIELLAVDCIDCVVLSMVGEAAWEVFSEVEDLKQVSISLSDEIRSTVETGLIRVTAEETIREAKVRRETLILLQKAINSVRDDLLEETVTNIVMSTATTVYRDAFNMKQLNEERDRACKAEADAILSNGVDDMVKSVASEVIKHEKMMQKEQLEQKRKMCLLLKLNRIFHHWMTLVTARDALRERLRHFPVGPPLLSTEQQLFLLKRSINPTAKSPSKQARIPKYLNPFEQESWLRNELHIKRKSLESTTKHLWQYLDLSDIANKCFLDGCNAHRVYWQLCVLTPDTLSDDVMKWLKAKFSGQKKSVEFRDVQTWCCHSVNYGKRNVHVCCKHIRGVPSLSQSENIHFYGTQSIVFVMESNGGDINWKSEARRLYSFCQSVPPSPGCSLLVLIPEELTQCSQTNIEQGLGLSNLYSSKSIVSCKTVTINLTNITNCKDNSPSIQLESAIQLLAKSSPSPPKLKCEPLNSFIESGISQLFEEMVSQDDQKRADRCLRDQNPDYVVRLFNSVIEYLSECCAGEYLQKYSWPIEEFSSNPDVPPLYWNSAERLAALQETVLSLRLPLPSSTGWSPELEFSDEHKVCLQYIQYTLSAPQLSNSNVLAFRIQQILCAAEASVNQLSDSDPTIFNSGKLSCIPWTSILVLLASHRTAALTVRECLADDDDDDRAGNVYYDPLCCCRFELPGQWVKGMSDTFLSDGQRLGVHRMDRRLGFDDPTVKPSQKAGSESHLTYPFHVLTASKDAICSAQSSAVHLSDSLAAARKESNKHNSQLEAWLESGSFVVACQTASKRKKKKCQATAVETKSDDRSQRQNTDDMRRLRPEEELSQRLQYFQRLLKGARWFESWEERSLRHTAAL